MQEQTPHHGPQGATIRAIAPNLEGTRETLRQWVREAKEVRPTPADEDRLKMLERESRELRRAKDILRTASAFFAAAELSLRELDRDIC